MKNINKYLWFLTIIGFLLIYCAYIQQFCPNWFNLSDATQNWLQSGLLNLGSGIITSVLIIFLYNRILDNNSYFAQKKRTEIAFKQMRIPLLIHFQMLMGMYRGAIENLPEIKMTKLEEVFDNKYIDAIKKLDLQSEPFGIGEERPWSEIIAEQCKFVQQQISEILFRYGQSFDLETTEAIEEFIGSDFITTAPYLPQKVRFNYGMKDINKLVQLSTGNKDASFIEKNNLTKGECEFFLKSLEKHVKLFVKLINIHNRLFPTQRLLWAEICWKFSNVKVGSSRVENNCNEQNLREVR